MHIGRQKSLIGAELPLYALDRFKTFISVSLYLQHSDYVSHLRLTLKLTFTSFQ
jgi:hypothetical protein